MSGPGRSVISIGNFDGVHAGHRALLGTARRLAAGHESRTGHPTRVLALAFDPHPATTLRPGGPPARLTTFQRRSRLLTDAGADQVIRLDPTPDLLSLDPEAFVMHLISAHAPVAFVEGADFRFGRARAGDVATLRALGRNRPEPEQFAVHTVDSVRIPLGDQSLVIASSTIARWLVAHGRMSDAARVLGRPYATEGVVVRGDRRGRTLGYPTANVEAESLLPADGVYAGWAHILDAATDAILRSYPAAVSVGTKPQFNDGRDRTLEAHLLDAPATPGEAAIAGLPEYGWRIRVEFNAFLREQARFDGISALVAQIDRDCRRTREVLLAAPSLPGAVNAALPDRQPPQTPARQEAATCP